MTDPDTAAATNHLPSPIPLSKRDARGRVQHSPAQREDFLDAYERSGLSGPVFARVAGINYQTFAGWRKARAQRMIDGGTGTPSGLGDASFDQGQGTSPQSPLAPGERPSSKALATSPMRFVEAVFDRPDLKGPSVAPTSAGRVLPGRALEVGLPGGAWFTIADAAQAALAAEFIAAFNHIRVC